MSEITHKLKWIFPTYPDGNNYLMYLRKNDSVIPQPTLPAWLRTGHSMSRKPNFQHSDPRMKLFMYEAKIMNSFGDFLNFFKKVGFLKIQISKIFWMTLKSKNLWRLVFRHIKLKSLTKASISCLSHPSMSITTWFMSVFATAKKYAFLHFHRAISEKLQHIKLWKFAVFHTSRGTSSNQVWIKSEMVGFFHFFTWLRLLTQF
jgi:hypothetical protein